MYVDDEGIEATSGLSDDSAPSIDSPYFRQIIEPISDEEDDVMEAAEAAEAALVENQEPYSSPEMPPNDVGFSLGGIDHSDNDLYVPSPQLIKPEPESPTANNKNTSIRKKIEQEHVSRVHGNNGSLRANFLLNPLEFRHRRNLVAHLYSAHLMHREIGSYPPPTWTGWPLRPELRDVLEFNEINPAAKVQMNKKKRIGIEMLKSSNLDKAGVLEGNTQFGITSKDIQKNIDKDEMAELSDEGRLDGGYIRVLPTFDSRSSAVPTQKLGDSVLLPLHQHFGSRVFGNVQGHGGGTQYTSVEDPTEYPYEELSRGIRPLDIEQYRTRSNLEEEGGPQYERDKIATEHARKLVLFEVNAAFQRLVHQRIAQENETRQKQNKKKVVPVVDPEIEMPQQARDNLMQIVDRILTTAGQNSNKMLKARNGRRPALDWIQMIQEDANVGRVYERCKALFLDDIDDPREALENDSIAENELSEDSKSKVFESKDRSTSSIRQPLTIKKLSRINLMSTRTPLPYTTPASRVHIPNWHGLADFGRYNQKASTEVLVLDNPQPALVPQSLHSGGGWGRDASTRGFRNRRQSPDMGMPAQWLISEFGLDPDIFPPSDVHTKVYAWQRNAEFQRYEQLKRIRRAQSRAPFLKFMGQVTASKTRAAAAVPGMRREKLLKAYEGRRRYYKIWKSKLKSRTRRTQWMKDAGLDASGPKGKRYLDNGWLPETLYDRENYVDDFDEYSFNDYDTRINTTRQGNEEDPFQDVKDPSLLESLSSSEDEDPTLLEINNWMLENKMKLASSGKPATTNPFSNNTPLEVRRARILHLLIKCGGPLPSWAQSLNDRSRSTS